MQERSNLRATPASSRPKRAQCPETSLREGYETDPEPDMDSGRASVRNMRSKCRCSYVLQFTFRRAVCCVLHRPPSQVIHCAVLSLQTCKVRRAEATCQKSQTAQTFAPRGRATVTGEPQVRGRRRFRRTRPHPRTGAAREMQGGPATAPTRSRASEGKGRRARAAELPDRSVRENQVC